MRRGEDQGCGAEIRADQPNHEDLTMESATSMPPAGECTKQQLRRLEKLKKAADRRAKSCHPRDSISTIQWKIARLEELKYRRQTIASQCFRGGDEEHRTAIQQVQNRINFCQSSLLGR